MIRILLAAALTASAAVAATVPGAVFDDETKSALARTHVTLVPLPGNPAEQVSMLSSDAGSFAFADVKPGWYLLRSTRPGYATAEFGQARPGQPGHPFEVRTADDSPEMRLMTMRRQASIVGSVVDDNGIGIPAWPVVVYTSRQPIERVTQGITDDRGNFRIGELDPGSYLVRSGAGTSEEAGALIPTYYKYGTTVAGAQAVHLRLGEVQAFVVIHAIEGQVFELAGTVTVSNGAPIRVTMITDTGRQVIASAAGPFTQAGVPAGPVDLLTEGPGCASFQRLTMDRNIFVGLTCSPLVTPVLDGAGSGTLIARRIDLDGRGAELAWTGKETLTPGHWQFTVRPGPNQYLAGIREDSADKDGTSRDGWFALDIGNSPHLRVTLSNKPASISGIVSQDGVPTRGARVYLESFDEAVPEVRLQSWTVRADSAGRYVFPSLPPGSYRAMSSFDVELDDPVGRGSATTVRIAEGAKADMPLIVIRQ